MSSSSPMRFAVFGQPVRHSLSPHIHATFARQCGINLQYEAIEAGPEAFKASLARFHAAGGRGANVTLPLKGLAAMLAVTLDADAARAGAVNTLIRRPDGWDGVNTDGVGFIADLRRLGVNVSGQRVALVGAGGAARGIVGPLLDCGVSGLVIANRSVDRARELVAHFADPRLSAIALDGLGNIGEIGLLVHAASAGHGVDPPSLPSGVCASQPVAYDLSYGPAAAWFMGWATASGLAVAHDGLGMLVEQAAAAFALWHGVRPDVEAVICELRNRREVA